MLDPEKLMDHHTAGLESGGQLLGPYQAETLLSWAVIITQTLEEAGVPLTEVGQRRAAVRLAAGGGQDSDMMASGMRRFVKQIIELWQGGFDSRRLLMTQVCSAGRAWGTDTVT